MKVQIEYVGKYQEKGVYEVEESRAVELLRLPEWDLVDGIVFEKKVKKDVNSFEKELIALPKIGRKTAKDILRLYPDRGSLVKACTYDGILPFDDDVVEVLINEFRN